MLYETTVDSLTAQARKDPDVIGLLLTGSVARGDAQPGTDIDLRYVLAPGLERPFRRFRTDDGVLVEADHTDLFSSISRLEANPMHAYAYLDGRILHDPEGALARLREHARQRYEAYRMPQHEKDELAFQLWCSRDKITVALDAGDPMKAAFAVGCGGWGIVQGLWAANDRPLPPHSSVRPHLGDLAGPPGLPDRFEKLFLADTENRIRTMLELLDWILPRLSPTLGDPTADPATDGTAAPAADPHVR